MGYHYIVRTCLCPTNNCNNIVIPYLSIATLPWVLLMHFLVKTQDTKLNRLKFHHTKAKTNYISCISATMTSTFSKVSRLVLLFSFKALWSKEGTLRTVIQGFDTFLPAQCETLKRSFSAQILSAFLQFLFHSCKVHSNSTTIYKISVSSGVGLYGPPCSRGLLLVMQGVLRTIQSSCLRTKNQQGPGLCYWTQVDPFSVLSGLSYGNSLSHESPLCSKSRGLVQWVDHLSLAPSLCRPSCSHFLLWLKLLLRFTLQQSFPGNHPVAGREPCR